MKEWKSGSGDGVANIAPVGAVAVAAVAGLKQLVGLAEPSHAVALLGSSFDLVSLLSIP